MSVPWSGSASRSHLSPRFLLRKAPLVVAIITVSVALGSTVIACTSASAGTPLSSASQRWLPSAWRNTPPLPPSADFTAPTNTWWTGGLLSSPPYGLNRRQDHTPMFGIGNILETARLFGLRCGLGAKD